MSIRQGNNIIAGTPDVTGKADTDLSNLTTTGKSTGAELSMPSDNYINLTVPASGSYYTAPANGYYCISGSGVSLYLGLEDSNGNKTLETWTSNSGTFIPVRKGQKILVGYSGTPSSFKFIYAEGEI